MSFLRFSQFLAEDDFTYTTEQDKTEQHVRRYVAEYIRDPKIELQPNGVSVTGAPKQNIARYVTVSGSADGIAVTTELGNVVMKMVNSIISDMIDQPLNSLKVVDSESNSSPGEPSAVSVTMQCSFRTADFAGQVDISINGTYDSEQVSNLSIDFNGEWHVD